MRYNCERMVMIFQFQEISLIANCPILWCSKSYRSIEKVEESEHGEEDVPEGNDTYLFYFAYLR